MHWTHWRARFEARSERPRPSIGDAAEIPPDLRPLLAGSLARFQLGETGEGRIVADLRRRADAWSLPADYLEALRLFIAEEGRHAAILGTAVRALGGRTLPRTWSADAFARVRRLAGPGLELLVLLAAEVAALSFYGTLVERLPSGPLCEALREIAGDEVVHLRFHVDFLRAALPSPVARHVVATAWAGLGVAAGAVVIADHGATLRRLGTSRRAVLGRARELVDDTVAGLLEDGPPRGASSRTAAAWCSIMLPTHPSGAAREPSASERRAPGGAVEA
jgi:hypothetical protein